MFFVCLFLFLFLFFVFFLRKGGECVHVNANFNLGANPTYVGGKYPVNFLFFLFLNKISF